VCASSSRQQSPRIRIAADVRRDLHRHEELVQVGSPRGAQRESLRGAQQKRKRRVRVPAPLEVLAFRVRVGVQEIRVLGDEPRAREEAAPT